MTIAMACPAAARHVVNKALRRSIADAYAAFVGQVDQIPNDAYGLALYALDRTYSPKPVTVSTSVRKVWEKLPWSHPLPSCRYLWQGRICGKDEFNCNILIACMGCAGHDWDTQSQPQDLSFLCLQIQTCCNLRSGEPPLSPVNRSQGSMSHILSPCADYVLSLYCRPTTS